LKPKILRPAASNFFRIPVKWSIGVLTRQSRSSARAFWTSGEFGSGRGPPGLEHRRPQLAFAEAAGGHGLDDDVHGVAAFPARQVPEAVGLHPEAHPFDRRVHGRHERPRQRQSGQGELSELAPAVHEDLPVATAAT
jgi:hypothetical protein